ncbi:hypothetical protein JNW88_17065 [Micromonospora sp. ATA32]|nr:hypothetical protein [Micromonospora sp. ATA32]
MKKTLQPDPDPGANDGSSDLDDGERAFAFKAFHQAAACRSSAALCMIAAMQHTAVATLATGGSRADVYAALDATYRRLILALDGALGNAIAGLTENVE